MDFTQRKLTKQEWENIEVPVNDTEKKVLKMIKDGFSDINIKYNYNQTILSYAKLEKTPIMEQHIFNLYLKKKMEKNYKKHDIKLESTKCGKIQPKKKDLIRLDNIKDTIDSNKESLYEFIILELIEKMLNYI